MTDVAIIGGGVVGCAVARELSRRALDVRLFEKASDLAEGTSKANSGIVHAGYDAEPGSLKARFNHRGVELMPAVCRELDVPYKQNGSLVVGFSDDDRARLEGLPYTMADRGLMPDPRIEQWIRAMAASSPATWHRAT